VIIPLFEGFDLMPLGAWGVGSSFASSGHSTVGGQQLPLSGSDQALYTYEIGVSSLYQRKCQAFTFYLGNALIRAGDATFSGGDSDTAEDYTTFRTGVEGRHLLGFQVGHIVPYGGLFFVYHHFFPSLQFTRATKTDLEVNEIFEVGATVGSTTPLELPLIGNLLDDMRIGVSYQAAHGLNGVRLSLGFPF
jgi:hypothetical protein